MLSHHSQYLRLYPTPWPVFSTKNFRQDNDGWWNPVKPKRRFKRTRQEFNNDTEPVVLIQQ
jgi:hypothetical protein